MATRWVRRMPAWLALAFLLGVGAAMGAPAEDPVAAGLLERVLHDADAAQAVQAGLDLSARYQARKDSGRAEAVLREVARRYPGVRTTEVCFELGYLLFQKHEWRPEALRWFRRAVAAGEPREKAAQAQLFAAYVYGEMGEQRQAEAEFARLRELFPGERRRIAQGVMDSIFFRSWTSPDPEGLLREAQAVRREYPEFGDIAGALDLVCGRLLASLGRPAEALPLFERVPADLDWPAASKAEALRESTLCLLQLGRVEDAKATLAAMAQKAGAARQKELASLGELVARCAPDGAHAALRVTVVDRKEGGPVPGALVLLRTGIGPDMARYTDDKGVALFEPLLPGEASILVWVGGRFPMESKAVTLAAGPEPATVEAKAYRALPDFPRASVRLLTPDGKPAADADVRVWGCFPPLLHSDADGAVAIPDIWRVPANAGKKVLLGVSDAGVATVDAAAAREGAVRLRPGAGIEGIVTGADGKPAFGAPVCAALLTATSHTVSGPDGTFRLGGLPPGEYLLAPLATPPQPGDKRAKSVTLHEGETVKDVRLSPDAP